MTGTSRVRSGGVHDDERGSLLAVEFSDVPFTVRRVFVVEGPPEGADRGNHVVPCLEEVVLLGGAAHFQMTAGDGSHVEEFVLEIPGQRATLSRGEHVRYRLAPGQSRILILAEDPYAGTST